MRPTLAGYITAFVIGKNGMIPTVIVMRLTGRKVGRGAIGFEPQAIVAHYADDGSVLRDIVQPTKGKALIP